MVLMVDFRKKGLNKKVSVARDKAPYFSEALGFSLPSLLVNPALDIGRGREEVEDLCLNFPSCKAYICFRGKISSWWYSGRSLCLNFAFAISGAGVLRFLDIRIMCLRVSDDIDAAIWIKNARTISTLFLTLIA